MRIAAMAAGAVGGYFGGRMQAAGHDVFFIARGANLAAIKSNGLKIESVHGDLQLPKVNATDDPRNVGPVDIVLFAVKLWDTETAAEATRPLVGPLTRVITLQNGVDSVERVAPILGAEQTIGGAAYIASVIGLARRHQTYQQFRHRALRPRRQARPTPRCKPLPMPARRPSSTSISPPISSASAGRNSFSSPPWPARPRACVRRSGRSAPTPSCAASFAR